MNLIRSMKSFWRWTMGTKMHKSIKTKPKKKTHKFQKKKGDLKSPGGKFDPDRRLWLQTEFVPGESGQDVGFPDPRVADQHDLEQVIVLMVHSMRHLTSDLKTKPNQNKFRNQNASNRSRAIKSKEFDSNYLASDPIELFDKFEEKRIWNFLRSPSWNS